MIDEKEKTEATTMLKRIKDIIFGTEVVEETTKAETPQSGFRIQKDNNGEPRWFAWVTNQWEDTEGHILTDSAHKEFEAFLDNNPEFAPELWVWHTPNTARKNRADWWLYSDGFFMYSGVLTEEEAKTYEELDLTDVGMSHGFFVLKYDQKKRHILKYRTFEVSELPRKRAANPFTHFMSIKEALEGENMFKDAVKRQYLVDRFGEDKVAELESHTEGSKAALEVLGVSMKELEQEIATEEAKAFEDKVTAAVIKATEAQSKQVAAEIVKAMNPEGLQEVISEMQKELEVIPDLKAEIATLKETIEHLKETEDVKIAEAIAPVSPFPWARSVTSDTVDSDDEELEGEIAAQAKAISTEKVESGWLKNAVSLV